MLPKGKYFYVLRDCETEKISVATVVQAATTPEPIDRSLDRVVEIPLCTEGKAFERLAELWVSDKMRLDQILQLLKSAPRLDTLDNPPPMQSFAFAESYTNEQCIVSGSKVE